MSKTTIENSKNGYTLRCEHCGDSYEMQTVTRSIPLWAFKSLAKGWEEEHWECDGSSLLQPTRLTLSESEKQRRQESLLQHTRDMCVQCGKSLRHCQCSIGEAAIRG